jgi:hypothetical protein
MKNVGLGARQRSHASSDTPAGVVNFLLDVSAAAGEIPTDPNDDDYNDDGNMHNAKLSHGAHGVPVHKVRTTSMVKHSITMISDHFGLWGVTFTSTDRYYF